MQKWNCALNPPTDCIFPIKRRVINTIHTQDVQGIFGCLYTWQFYMTFFWASSETLSKVNWPPTENQNVTSWYIVLHTYLCTHPIGYDSMTYWWFHLLLPNQTAFVTPFFGFSREGILPQQTTGQLFLVKQTTYDSWSNSLPPKKRRKQMCQRKFFPELFENYFILSYGVRSKTPNWNFRSRFAYSCCIVNFPFRQKAESCKYAVKFFPP